jgi:anti-sigma regulatory factor (Ser/Thr protein kinase)
MWWLASLPRRDSLRLEADQAAPRAARHRLAKILPEWSLPQFETVALLVTSELVTNAVLATNQVQWTAARPPVRLWVRGDPSVLAILTWDAIPAPPVPREAGDYDESGRGLAIVESLSARWGHYQARFGGKVTWSVIDSA